MRELQLYVKQYILFVLVSIFLLGFNTAANADTSTQALASQNINIFHNLENRTNKRSYANSNLSRSLNLSLVNKGMVFTGSQAITTLDGGNNFAVGKWDNTIQIMNSNPYSKYPYAPTLLQTLVIDTNNGIQMLAYLNQTTFASSNDENSLAIWQVSTDHKYKLIEKVSYANLAPNAGIANSGGIVNYNGIRYFISGHENGYIIIWEFTGNGLKYIKAVNVQSPNPIHSPYNLKNIRGISLWRDSKFVTGSEDGDLVLINIDGTILDRIRYNPSAQRGINQIQTLGNYLLVSNCEVGADDKNLWLYNISDNKITYLDSLNLKKDQTLKQVFNFGISLGIQDGQILFFASTEEGILWSGFIVNNKLNLVNSLTVSGNLGSVLYYNQTNGVLIQSAYDTHVFKVTSDDYN